MNDPRALRFPVYVLLQGVPWEPLRMAFGLLSPEDSRPIFLLFSTEEKAREALGDRGADGWFIRDLPNAEAYRELVRLQCERYGMDPIECIVDPGPLLRG